MYEFEFEIFKYICNLYLSNGVVWVKLADTSDSLPHPRIRSLMSVVLGQPTSKIDLWCRSTSAGTKIANFYITQRVSDTMTGTKDRLPTDTINCFL
jgi:hypothetical protein